MSTPLLLGLLGAGILIIVGIFMIRIFRISQNINLTDTPEGEKPEWLKTDPPPETVAETKKDGEKISLYDFDPGEDLAAAFAEQIEDIIHHLMEKDPDLRSLSLDLGTAPDGGIEYHFEGETYTNADHIPDANIQDVIKRAIDIYNSRE